MKACLTYRPALSGRSIVAGVFACFSLSFGSQSLSSPDYNRIVGDWDSNFGPVHLDFVAPEQPSGSAAVSGHWMETLVHRGEIEAGHYNARTGELVVLYVETWSKHHGEAKLKLDVSGKRFSGKFKSDDGSTGTWTWKRKH